MSKQKSIPYNELTPSDLRDLIIVNGCDDKLFESMMDRGPEFMQRFWTEQANIPLAFEGQEAELSKGRFAISEKYARHCCILSGDENFDLKDTIKQHYAQYTFYQKDDKGNKLPKSDAMNTLEAEMTQGWNYNMLQCAYGHFIGATIAGETQSLMPAILEASVRLKSRGLSGDEMAQTLQERLKGVTPRGPFSSPQISNLLGGIGWRSDACLEQGSYSLTLGVDENGKHESHGSLALIKWFNLCQSDRQATKEPSAEKPINPYCLSDNMLTVFSGKGLEKPIDYTRLLEIKPNAMDFASKGRQEDFANFQQNAKTATHREPTPSCISWLEKCCPPIEFAKRELAKSTQMHSR